MEYHIDYPQFVNKSILVGGNNYYKLEDGTFLDFQVIPGEYIYLRLYPQTIPPAQCWAQLQENILTLARYTRDKSGNPLSPYLYAKEFFDFSIYYFGIDNIARVRADLNPGSSVREEIINAYGLTSDLKYAAEICTFSRHARDYGFNKVNLRHFRCIGKKVLLRTVGWNSV